MSNWESLKLNTKRGQESVKAIGVRVIRASESVTQCVCASVKSLLLLCKHASFKSQRSDLYLFKTPLTLGVCAPWPSLQLDGVKKIFSLGQRRRRSITKDWCDMSCMSFRINLSFVTISDDKFVFQEKVSILVIALRARNLDLSAWLMASVGDLDLIYSRKLLLRWVMGNKNSRSSVSFCVAWMYHRFCTPNCTQDVERCC